MSDDRFILYETDGPVATVVLDRPEVRNAQNPAFIEQFDVALRRGAEDEDIRVIVVRANGPHWSSGHDISAEGASHLRELVEPQRGVAGHYGWEQDNYLGIARRWRDLPKPTIAAVHGKCIAGGLMLCWPCDLIVASEGALFSDPVLRMGIPGVEYHGHPWELGARKAKEFLFTGDEIDAREAWRLGMVNHVVPREQLEAKAYEIAKKIACMDPFALRMAKQAVNRTLDGMGQWSSMQAVFEMHHLAHAHVRIVSDAHQRRAKGVESTEAAS